MNIAYPKLPAHLPELAIEDMLRNGELENGMLQDRDAVNSNVEALELTDIVAEKIVFTGSHFHRIVARDVIMRHSDFSSVSLDSGHLVRVEFTNCRMTGVDFNQTILHDVTFKDCKLDLANFRKADLRRVAFIDCTFQETDFAGAQLNSVDFQSCTLENTTFDQSRCQKLDLRTSQLIAIQGWKSLKGATIDGVQLISAAPYLAHELGISVSDTF
jgi:uncharacterized protein YjbI with pentapeptide repeats